MGKMGAIMLSRKISVIILVSLGAIVLLSGMLLGTAPSGPGSGESIALGLTKDQWVDIHVYSSFALAGGAIIHAYTNYRGILYHTGLLKFMNRFKRGRRNVS